MQGYGCRLGFSTLAEPIPWAWVCRLPTGFPLEFELRSTVTDMVDLAFQHSYAIPLGSTKVAGHIKR